MWKVSELMRTFAVLCIIALLILFCVNQSFKIQDMTSYIGYHRDSFTDQNYDKDVLAFDQIRDTKPAGVNDIKYPIFQSNVSVEFPHIVNGTSRIPHIIHQICNIPFVPVQFVDAMKSFVKLNPTWEYRFWTYDSGRKLLEKRHPYLVDVYDSFGENDVKKSDLLRYAIIYEYGGLYADLDVENLRSLNKTTTKYACILPTEPFEHAGIIYLKEAIMSSAVLLCRPRHPFYYQLLINLQLANPKGHPVGTTGPVYLTDVYLKYNDLTERDLTKSVNDNRTNSPYFYKGKRDEESDDGIYIPNSQYFTDNVDQEGMVNTDGEVNECVQLKLSRLLVIKQRACKEFESRKVLRKEREFAFTLHYWFHLWTVNQEGMQRLHLKDFIPSAIFYEG